MYRRVLFIINSLTIMAYVKIRVVKEREANKVRVARVTRQGAGRAGELVLRRERQLPSPQHVFMPAPRSVRARALMKMEGTGRASWLATVDAWTRVRVDVDGRNPPAPLRVWLRASSCQLGVRG